MRFKIVGVLKPSRSSHQRCYNNCYNETRYHCCMLDHHALTAIRKKLGLSQEQMARLIGVSFVTVNRWEGGHSSPTGPLLDLYLALRGALQAAYSPAAIVQASNGERGAFLYSLFKMAYGPTKRRA